MDCLLLIVTAQVRQPLYKTSVQRWKVYRQQLEPLREALAPLIARYEQMLQQRLASPADFTSVVGQHGDELEEGSDDSSDSAKDEL